MNNSIYQTKEWEEFKLATGYTKSFWVNDILVLERKLLLGRAMLYSPMVSEVQLHSIQDSVNSKQFLKEINKIAKDNNSIFFRLEIDSENDKWKMINGKWLKAFEEMQPENNWLVDISQSEEEILSNMKQKGRYNIKVAEKNNLTFEFLDKSDLNIFYTQYSRTGERHKVTYRNEAYFKKLLEIFGEKEYARMCTVYGQIDGKKTPLASAILLNYGDEVQYLFGASSDEFKNLMAPYMLHWEIMKWAKENGYKKYNFLGVAPDEDPSHPWAGITRFKKQFGGYQYDIAGCYDLVFKPIEYKLFKIAEKIRRR